VEFIEKDEMVEEMEEFERVKGRKL